MKKRIIAVFLTIVVALSGRLDVFACNQTQSDTYVTQILFGDMSAAYSNDKEVDMLLSALYLCSMQSDNQGSDELSYLRRQKIKDVPHLETINIKDSELLSCSHDSWESSSAGDLKQEKRRKKLLQNTVNKVFDFGLLDNWFGSDEGQCEGFAALLYYSHILADYLADDPEQTDAVVNGQGVSSFTGIPYIEINGNRPTFTKVEKKSTDSFARYSQLDTYGRAGVAFANIGSDIMPPSGSRQNIGYIKPSGWNQDKYPGLVNSEPAYLYNRCHLIAHELAGNDTEVNLITGTRYLNIEGMYYFEDQVAKYMQQNPENHVLYRATPVFEGDNMVASGIQLEAYSVEDSGKGISFNVYCYNVQPGVDINYSDGKNERADTVYGSDETIPFVTDIPSDNNPDLIFEMQKYMETIFQSSDNKNTYTSMMGEIDTVANEARAIIMKNEKEGKKYIELKKYEFKYFEILKAYIPKLLEKEEFFKSAF